jgi:hypothetical protein
MRMADERDVAWPDPHLLGLEDAFKTAQWRRYVDM